MTGTRVGYAGGTSPAPTYHDLDGHSESIRVTYNPAVISYGDLLRVFFEAHHPTSPAWSRQYASVIFAGNDEERREAEATLAAEQTRRGRPLFTEIRPRGTFHSAEDYHQKYYLRQRDDLLDAIHRRFADVDAFIDSTAAMRANAFVGGYLDEASFLEEMTRLGLSPEERQRFATDAGSAFCGF